MPQRGGVNKKNRRNPSTYFKDFPCYRFCTHNNPDEIHSWFKLTQIDPELVFHRLDFSPEKDLSHLVA